MNLRLMLSIAKGNRYFEHLAGKKKTAFDRNPTYNPSKKTFLLYSIKNIIVH